MTDPRAGDSPGWYPYFGGLRFFDGQEWTGQIAPPPPKPAIGIWEIAAGVFVGIVLAQIIAGIFVLLVFGLSFNP